MEEILASIRRIISEDSGPDEAAQAAEEPAPAPQPEPEPEDDDILELTEALPEDDVAFEEPAPVVEPEPIPEPAPAPVPEEVAELIDDVQFAEPEPEPEPVYEPAPEPVVAAEPEPVYVAPAPAPEEPAEIEIEEPVMSTNPQPGLLSRDAEAAASAAFGVLASSLASGGGGRTIEEIVSDMLQPMLKEWLDENLPSLVERLVAEEIERVSRRKG